jgi:hypothetical protein
LNDPVRQDRRHAAPAKELFFTFGQQDAYPALKVAVCDRYEQVYLAIAKIKTDFGGEP